MSHALDLLKRANAQLCLDTLTAGPRRSASSDGSSEVSRREDATVSGKRLSAETWLESVPQAAQGGDLIGAGLNGSGTEPEGLCSVVTLSDVIFRLVNVRPMPGS